MVGILVTFRSLVVLCRAVTEWNEAFLLPQRHRRPEPGSIGRLYDPRCAHAQCNSTLDIHFLQGEDKSLEERQKGLRRGSYYWEDEPGNCAVNT